MITLRTPFRLRCAYVVLSTFLSIPSVTLMAGDGLVVTASYSQSLKPQSVRLVMSVEAQGKDPKDAIKRLAEHKDKIRKELVAMKAIESSIEFSAPTVDMITPGVPPQMQQYGRMRAMQMQMQAQAMGGAGLSKGGEEDEEDKLPEIAVAKTSLKVDWQLPTTDLEALSIVPRSLREQVVQRDIAGKKNKIELDEEMQERIDESMAMMREQMGYYPQEEQADSIQVLFVGVIGDQEAVSGMKGAYGRAAAQAKALSEASGIKAGKLKGITTNHVNNPDVTSYYSGYAAVSMPASVGVAVTGFKPNPNEVTNPSPQGLEMEYSVTLTYEILE